MKLAEKAHEAECPRMGTLEGGEPSPWGPVGEDGAPNPGAVNAAPAPAREFTPAEVPCIRGPCRFYFQAISHFDHGNPAGTFAEGYEPVQRHHWCKAIAGVPLELSADSPVYECNHWDPVDATEQSQLEHRRSHYFEKHPDHRPPERPDLGDDGEVDIDEEDDVA